MVQATEMGREGWFPPSFCKTVEPSRNQTEIGRRLLRTQRLPDVPRR